MHCKTVFSLQSVLKTTPVEELKPMYHIGIL